MCWWMILVCLNVAESIPLKGKRDNGDGLENSDPVSAIEFMKRFGYLDPGNPNSEALYTEQAVQQAIAKVQEFAGLIPTGNLDAETVELLKTPRCGNPDVTAQRRTKRFVIGSSGWKKQTLTYYLANWSPKLANESFVLQELSKAFQMWSDYSRLRFRRTDIHSEADMVILFGRYHHGDNYPFDGAGTILAHAYYPYDFGGLGGDIHFDEDEDWSPDARLTNEGMDFFSVAIHEIGHALGLAHSPSQDSVMFPYYRGPARSPSLGYDDILAVYQHYISRPPVERPAPEDADTTLNPITTTTTTETTTITFEKFDQPDPPDAGDESYVDVGQGEDEDFYQQDDQLSVGKTSFPQTSTQSYDNIPKTTTLTYMGDVEDVDEHIRRREEMRKKPHVIPDICDGTFDVITSIRREIFIFKNQYMWRFSSRRYLVNGYPTKITQMFPGLPSNLTRIDAVYERPTDNSILFFIGDVFYTMKNNVFDFGSKITSLDLPEGLDRLDAAFVWGKNDMTYFFRNSMYWKYDEKAKRMEDGYPQDLSRWQGLPDKIDSVFTNSVDGYTYFFSGHEFWRFDDAVVQVEENYPKNTKDYWMRC